MASSVPAAVDWLVTNIRAATATTVVSDGWPATRGNDLIAIGVTPDDDEAEATATYAQLSGQEHEDVTLPLLISARRAGPKAASTSRAAAVQLLDTVRSVIAGDRRLGGAVLTGMPARVSRWRLRQTSEAKQAGEGRTCRIIVTISWQHRG